jgi:3-methylcrotonyl-CoA carboxylase alpha subunit
MRTGQFTVRLDDEPHRVTVGAAGEVRVDDGVPLVVTPAGRGAYRVDNGTLVRGVLVIGSGDRRQVFVGGETYDLVAVPESAGRGSGRAATDLLSAPMPARVTAIAVEAGQAAREGDVLVRLEAMRMGESGRAPPGSSVARIACQVGELVQPGVALLEMTWGA